MSHPKVRVGMGQSSHRFLSPDTTKPCIVAGLIFEDAPGFSADSDGDVVFHSICNAIASVTGIPILSGVANDLCHKGGITDSQVYLERALETLEQQKIEHIALTVEGKRPYMQKRIEEMRAKIAQVLKIRTDQVGLTVISGEGLTDFGCGDGVQCLSILTTLQ